MKPSFDKNSFKNYKEKVKPDNKRSNKSNAASSPFEKHKSGNNQIISGHFVDEKSYKELIIQRINNFLYCLLGILVIFCFVGYYFVSCKEVQLNQISRETLDLNYENEELQNKLDSLQSYYNIDKAVSKANILERARHVVEVDAIDLPKGDSGLLNKNRHSFVVSY